jgi:hypothetical protein
MPTGGAETALPPAAHPNPELDLEFWKQEPLLENAIHRLKKHVGSLN